MLRKITLISFFTCLSAGLVLGQVQNQSVRPDKKSQSIGLKPDKPEPGTKQVDVQISSANGYVAGSTHNVFLTVVVANTDFEYVDSLAITLPSDMTLNSVSNDEFFGPSFDPGGDPEAFNGIDGQTVSWGDNDNTYGGITAQGSVYTFSMNITFDESLSGPQELQVHASGDGFGPSPGDDDLVLTLDEEVDEARLQIIHNAADAAAEVVDVRVNGDFPDPSLDDFAFRTATAYLTVPATEDLEVTINDPSSTDDSDPLFSETFNLDPGITYQIIAEGIVSMSGYDPATPFSLEVFAQAREEASEPGLTDVLVHHGSTDAPTVDVFEPFVGIQLINDISYPEYQGYLSLETADYILQLTLENGTTPVQSYQAPLSTLGLDGAAISVLASGFLNPSDNSDGPAFGLWVALPDGGPLVELETEALAQVQVIHNSPDLAAPAVDVRINGELEEELDDLGFRTASPFLPLNAEVPLTITVNDQSSEDDSDPLFELDLSEGLEANQKYIIFAEGILSESGYTPGSDEVPFNLNVFTPALQSASMDENVDVLVSHGSPDAPPVDVNELTVPVPELVDNIAFGEIQGYLELATSNYALEIALESDGTVVEAYTAALENLGLEGAAITVLASGFVDPESNSDGPSFGLWTALPGGGPLIELPLFVANDSPCGAIPLETDGSSETATNSGAITDENEVVPPSGDCESNFAWCDGEEGEDAEITNTLWYSFTAPASGVVQITTCNPATDFDTQVAVWSAEDCADYGTFEFVGANDDYPAGQDCAASTLFASTLLVCGLNEGQTYYVQVDGFLGATGNSEISIEALDAADCTARLQVVHNSADGGAAVVDVRVNGEFPADDFDDLEFRTATATIDAPANVLLDITINPPESVDADDPLLLVEDVILSPGESYQVVAQGIVTEVGYDPGNDLAPLDLLLIEGYQEEGANPDNTLINVVHGATDAPAVDVDEINLVMAELVGNLSYNQFEGYLDLATQNYQIGITQAGDDVVIAAFDAPLADLLLGGQAITVFASGFLDPSNNSMGPEFGLWVSLPEGGPLIPLDNVTSVEETEGLENLIVFPNPTNTDLTVELTLSAPRSIAFDLFDATGRLVKASDLGQRGSGLNREVISVNDVAPGIYLLNISVGEEQLTRRIHISD
jgi:hypothetical protein